MIDDSIRRSDVIDKLMHIIPYKRYHNGEYILLLNKKECLSAIKAMPSADSPQGEWIDEHEDGYGSWVGTCNQCGKENHVDNFCPNCGARMKGADDE